MADENKPIHWAAGLVEALKKAHVGHGKVELIRQAMAERFNHSDHSSKDQKHPDRHLTAREAIAILERAGVGEVTLEKARQLAATGMWNPPAPINPADALPPPPDAPAPVRAIPAPEVASTPALTSIGGTVDLSADVDTVGLKPIEGAPGDTVQTLQGQPHGAATAPRGRRNRRPLDATGPSAVVSEDAGAGSGGVTDDAPEG